MRSGWCRRWRDASCNCGRTCSRRREPMPTDQATLYGQAMDRMMASLERWSDQIATNLMGGDLFTDQVDVPQPKYNEFVFEHWDDPQTRASLQQQVGPEVFFRRALKVMSPDLSPSLGNEWIKVMRLGMDPNEATRLIDQRHQAELLRK